MRYVSRAAFLFLLVVGGCLAGGCSETTGPDENHGPSTGKHLWSKSFGDWDSQWAHAVAVDASGNVIVAGYIQSTVDFGGGALTSAGSDDIFVAKFGSEGSHLWSQRFGDGDLQRASALAVDAPGNVVVTGRFSGTVDFGGGTLTSAGSDDIFVAKFGSDGSHLWSKRFGDGSVQVATAVAVDASGNVVVTGYFSGTVDFGGGTLTSAGYDDDIFVAKFGADGSHLWSQRFGDGDLQRASALAVDAPGNVIVTGAFYGTVDFGGAALTSAGYYDIFVARFGSDGGHLWSQRFGDGSSQVSEAVAVDASGNMIVTGSFGGKVDFGGGALTSAGFPDIFVAKFGP